MSDHILTTFIQVYRQNKEVARLFRPKALPEELQRFTSEMNCHLPEHFLKLYEYFNGTVEDKTNDFNNHNLVLLNNTTCLLSLDEIIREKKMWDGFVNDMETGFNPRQSFGGWHLCWFWNKAFVPFQATAYEFLVIDMAGVKTGRQGQVIRFYTPDQPGATIMYNSFEHYLKTLSLLLQNNYLLTTDSFSEEYQAIYTQVNGEYNQDNELMPHEILPQFDWRNIYHF